MFTLYHYQLCPSSRFIRILLDEFKIEHITQLENYWKPQDELAGQLTQWELSGRSLVFAIGGADGWCDDVRARADVQWSLSNLVFPHPLARVIVIEQLYRADSVRQGHPYHRS